MGAPRAPRVADPAYLSARQVGARFGISDATLDRWLVDDELDFPRPMVIRGQRYFDEEKLLVWERQRKGELEEPADVALVELPVLSAVIRDYRGLVEALRAARCARGLSGAELDHRSGMQDGYTSKLENWTKGYGRGLNTCVMPLWLGGLRVGLVVVDLSGRPAHATADA